MKFSKLFLQTFKEVPVDAQVPSHQLLHRAGFIQKAGTGLYHYSPLMMRVIEKTQAIIREELAKVDCLEISMSMATPAELWQESGRWDELGDLMVQFKDRLGRHLCLSPTNEESVVDYFRKTAKSYKQLPVCLYQINTKFRDEIRPRFGLMRAREFIMKDAYSFHIDKTCLDTTYQQMYDAYASIFSRMGLDVLVVEADAGAMADSGAKTHEFQVLADTGEDSLVVCKTESKAQNAEMAITKRNKIDTCTLKGSIEDVQTPEKNSIEDVCAFLKVPQTHALKSMLFVGTKDKKKQYVLACCLGDDNINTLKVAQHTGVANVELMSEDESSQLGFEMGVVGPVKCNPAVTVIIDSHVDETASYIVGANKKNVHLKNVCISRDIATYSVYDIREACETDVSEKGNPIKMTRGIEVGHIFQLGQKYTKALKADVLNNQGKATHPLMGCYGIGVGRAIAAAVEQHHDEKGIVWPVSIAPYHVVILPLFMKDDTCKAAAETFYVQCKAKGLEVMIDDRECSPGIKFKDAELIGIPYQVVFGKTFKLDQTVEYNERKTAQRKTLSVGDCMAELSHKLAKK